MTSWYFYPYKALTGGADGALDSLDGSSVKDKDGAFVLDHANEMLRAYWLDEDSAAAESSPGVIAPDANAGNKRWKHVKWDPAYMEVLQSGTGALSVAINTLMNGIYSVASWGPATDGTTTAQTAIAAAVLAAYTGGFDLYWPKGTYLTTANIPYLHSVRHWGPGIIKRGSNLFAVAPKRSNTNTLYCTTSGVATNDGLDTTEPITVTAAAAALENYGPMLHGKWDIDIAAGTYTERDIVFPIGLQSEYLILVRGPDVSGGTPTAIFDAEDTNDFSFKIRNGTSVFFKDLKFIDHAYGTFEGNYAISASGGCILATSNIHSSNCTWTIHSFNSRLYVSGGDYSMTSNNSAAILSMYCQLHNIGYLYNRDTAAHSSDGAGNGPVIYSATSAQIDCTGLYISEDATGHVNGCTITNMSRGAYVRSRSRANFDDCDFKKNICAIEAELNSDITTDATVTFNEGTADANDQTFRFHGGALHASDWNVAVSPMMVKKAIGSSVTDPTLTGTLSAYTFHTFSTFFDGHEFAKEGYLRIRMFGSITGTNGTKTFRARFGTDTIMALVFPAAADGDFFCEMVMHMADTDTQKAYGFGTCSDSSAEAITSDYTVTLTTGAAMDLLVQGVLGHVDDSVTVEGIEVWRGGA